MRYVISAECQRNAQTNNISFVTCLFLMLLYKIANVVYHYICISIAFITLVPNFVD